MTNEENSSKKRQFTPEWALTPRSKHLTDSNDKIDENRNRETKTLEKCEQPDSPISFEGLDDELCTMTMSDDTCPYCHQTYRQPRLLHCLHALCEDCIVAQLERRPDQSQMRRGRGRFMPSIPKIDGELEPTKASEKLPPPGVIRCPVCHQDSQVGNDIRFVSSLLVDYVTRNMLETRAISDKALDCESCKLKEKAIARCKDCNKFICNGCVDAHRSMTCFDGHTVLTFDELRKPSTGNQACDGLIHRQINCPDHPNEALQFTCGTCQKPICSRCVVNEHRPTENHNVYRIDEQLDGRLRGELQQVLEVAQRKIDKANAVTQNCTDRMEQLRAQLDNARESVEQTFDQFREILEEHRKQMLRELETLYERYEKQMYATFDKIASTSAKVHDASNFAQRLVDHGNTTEILKSRRTVLMQLVQLLSVMPELSSETKLRYVGDVDNFRNKMYACCGHFETDGLQNSEYKQPSPIEPVLQQAVEADIYSTGVPADPRDLPLAHQQALLSFMSSPQLLDALARQQPNSRNHAASFFMQKLLEAQRAGTIDSTTGSANSATNHIMSPCDSGISQMKATLSSVNSSASIASINTELSQSGTNASRMTNYFNQAPGSITRTPTNANNGLMGQAPPPPLAPSCINPAGVIGQPPSNLASLTNKQPSNAGSPLHDPNLYQWLAYMQQNIAQQRFSGNGTDATSSQLSKAPPPVPPPNLQYPMTPQNLQILRAHLNALTSLHPTADLYPTMLQLLQRHQAAVAATSASDCRISSASALTSTATSYSGAWSHSMPQQTGSNISPPMGSVNNIITPIGQKPIKATSPIHVYNEKFTKLESNPNTLAALMRSQQQQSNSASAGMSPIDARQMEVLHRFGTLGHMHGQFNSPHGFCLGFDDDIVVADTNNHRIQIFNKHAKFVSVFGEAGKEDGQLWYPRKVAILRKGEHKYYVVCDRGNERSRMQIFTKDGNYIKKIAIRYVDIVAGLAVDAEGNIVAVDSVSPTVFVIGVDKSELKHWFDCSAYMKEPSDIAVSDKKYYICDFKGHCVCLFTHEGTFIRRIGGENLTSFPNGIDVSDEGDVLIGDSHGNKFHVALFDRTGKLISEYDCPNLKVSRCCGLRITSEGHVVTLAKNNHYCIILNTLHV